MVRDGDAQHVVQFLEGRYQFPQLHFVESLLRYLSTVG